MISKAKVNAIETLKLDQNEKSLRISLLIKEYINLNFMAKATTGSFWKKATFLQRQKYKTAIIGKIINGSEPMTGALAHLFPNNIKS